MEPPPSPPDLSRDFRQRFELLGFLGRGGMGQVWSARQSGLDRPVALKFLESGSKEARERFLREARVMASAPAHPHIMRIFEVGEDGEQVFLVLELVEGPTLDRLERTGDPGHTLTILQQVAAALDALHAAGFVHRDVKPGNVFVAAGRAVLGDFGLARSTTPGQTVTQAGVTLGTPVYMAPEQVAGEPAGPAADRFALAVMAFELVTGALPFAGETMSDQLAARLRGPARTLAAVRSGLPTAWEAVFQRGLSRDPGGRYASGAAFVAALEAGLEEGTHRLTRAVTPLSASGATTRRILPADAGAHARGTRRVIFLGAPFAVAAVALASGYLAGRDGTRPVPAIVASASVRSSPPAVRLDSAWRPDFERARLALEEARERHRKHQDAVTGGTRKDAIAAIRGLTARESRANFDHLVSSYHRVLDAMLAGAGPDETEWIEAVKPLHYLVDAGAEPFTTIHRSLINWPLLEDPAIGTRLDQHSDWLGTRLRGLRDRVKRAETASGFQRLHDLWVRALLDYHLALTEIRYAGTGTGRTPGTYKAFAMKRGAARKKLVELRRALVRDTRLPPGGKVELAGALLFLRHQLVALEQQIDEGSEERVRSAHEMVAFLLTCKDQGIDLASVNRELRLEILRELVWVMARDEGSPPLPRRGEVLHLVDSLALELEQRFWHVELRDNRHRARALLEALQGAKLALAFPVDRKTPAVSPE